MDRTTGIGTRRVNALAQERLDWRLLAVPASAQGLTFAEFVSTRSALDDLGTPLMALGAAALDRNLRTMANWCTTVGVDLVPQDVVRLGFSHRCTAFDKWTPIPVLDDADADHPRVVDPVRTFF
jgi:D-serine deaminase-like pyridoxal phosphate-dependent protein